MEPTRILHMIGCLGMGGSQTMLLNLYRAIDREKVQFDLILDRSENNDLLDQFEALGAKVYVLPCYHVTNTLQVRRAWREFFQEHPEYKILHSHVRSYASIYLPIAKKYGLKTIIHSHSTSNGRGITSVAKKILQYPLRFQADYFMGCSEESGRWLFGEKVVKSDRFYLLKNAIDANVYRHDPEKRMEYRKLLGIGDEKVFIHVGRFHPAKNHEFLLNVFAEVHRRDQKTVLVLVGDGDLRETIQAKIRELHLADSVIMLGNRKDVPELLQAADCFLFPSLYEGLGIVAIEAQAAALPCICSESVPRLAKVTDNCVFLPYNEDMWIKEALKSHHNRIDTYHQIVSAGYDIQKTMTWLQPFYLQIDKTKSTST